MKAMKVAGDCEFWEWIFFVGWVGKVRWGVGDGCVL